MRTRYKLLIMLIAATAMTFSCENTDEPVDPSVENPSDKDDEEEEGPQVIPSIWDGSSVTFPIASEAPAEWTVGDVVNVFDDDFVRVAFTASESGSNVPFTSEKWTAYIPAYAVYSTGTQYCDTDEGIIKYVVLPAEQKLSGDETYVRTAFPAIGKFEEDEESGYKLESMKNISARVEFTFVDNKTKALKIEGLNSEIIAGQGNIRYEGFEWTPKEGASAASINLLPAGDAFSAGTTVYASLLPGNFEKGIRVTLTSVDDFDVVRTFFVDEGILIERNATVQLPDAIDTPQSQWSSSVVNTNVEIESPSAWESQDVITVFDVTGNPVPFTTDAVSTPAVFSTREWTASVPAVAAFSSDAPSYAPAAGTVSLTVPVQQKISSETYTDHKAMPAISVIKEDEQLEYVIPKMSNLAGRIAMRFLSNTTVKSVKIQGANNEPLAGEFTYDLVSGSITGATENMVMITPDGLTFEGGSIVYATVLPGTYSAGIKVVMTMSDNSLLTKTFGEESGLVVERNEDLVLPEIVDLPSIEFPDEFVVAVNLQKGWPFMESYAAGVNEYSMEYSEGLNLDFAFDGTYTHSGGLDFSAPAGKLILPQVEGRYLNSVVIVHESTGSKNMSLHKVSDDSKIGNEYKTHITKQPIPVAYFNPHSTERCYVSLVDAMKITNIYLRYTSIEDGSDAVKLGFECQWKPYNNYGGEGNGSTYVNDTDNTSPFTGISYNKNNNWDSTNTTIPYTFTQTVNGVTYTFESILPSSWNLQYLYGWSNGMFNCNWGTPNMLKLPRTGKLVWAATAIYNAYNADKTNRTMSIEAKDQGDSGYTNVGAVTHMAAVAQGTGDGTTVANSAGFKTWCLEDAYSPTKDYYLSCEAGNTTIICLVLIYL